MRRLVVLSGLLLLLAPLLSGAARAAARTEAWPYSVRWIQLATDPATPAATRQRELERRFGAGPARHLWAALERAEHILPTIEAAFLSPADLSPDAGVTRHKVTFSLADYAKSTGGEPERYENFISAARRIVAGETAAPSLQTVEATSQWLRETADAIAASVRAAEAARRGRNAELDAVLVDLRLWAQIARFHARRAIGAVHYNLFLRNLQLAELVAATYVEKEVVALWRELVALAAAHARADPALRSAVPQWQTALKILETNYKELEEQCCPPDEAAMTAKIWLPAGAADPRTAPPSPAALRP